MKKNEQVTITVNREQARNLSFLLGESYSKWGMELNHYSKVEDVYPLEVIEMLDLLDYVGDQLKEQGIDWNDDAGI